MSIKGRKKDRVFREFAPPVLISASKQQGWLDGPVKPKKYTGRKHEVQGPGIGISGIRAILKRNK